MASPRIQLFVSVGNRYPHDSLQSARTYQLLLTRLYSAVGLESIIKQRLHEYPDLQVFAIDVASVMNTD